MSPAMLRFWQSAEEAEEEFIMVLVAEEEAVSCTALVLLLAKYTL